jgi:hypothetical protein
MGGVSRDICWKSVGRGQEEAHAGREQDAGDTGGPEDVMGDSHPSEARAVMVILQGCVVSLTQGPE